MLQPCRIFSEHHASIMISISPFAPLFGHFIFQGAIGPSSNISILHLYKSLDAFLCPSEGEELGISLEIDSWDSLRYGQLQYCQRLPWMDLLYIQLPKVARCIFQVTQVTRDVFCCPDSKRPQNSTTRPLSFLSEKVYELTWNVIFKDSIFFVIFVGALCYPFSCHVSPLLHV